MDDNGELDPSTEFSPESSWTLTDDVYFFGTDRESSILREFGWNLQPELRFGDFDRIVPELSQGARVSLPERSTVSSAAQAGPVEKVGDASMLNQSVSSSSSEDPAEKSTDSGAGGKLPAESESKDIDKDKKKGPKGIRQQRVAFMTKSEVDHLEDGYRWRKYGQKAVKNSPFPRSYYRCTNSKCTVKKRVERSFEDPTIVITTYEGHHSHHTAGIFPRGLISSIPNFHNPSPSHFHNPVVYPFNPQQLQSRSTIQPCQVSVEARDSHARVPTPMHLLPSDEGLLGDMVHPGIRDK